MDVDHECSLNAEKTTNVSRVISGGIAGSAGVAWTSSALAEAGGADIRPEQPKTAECRPGAWTRWRLFLGACAASGEVWR